MQLSEQGQRQIPHLYCPGTYWASYLGMHPQHVLNQRGLQEDHLVRVKIYHPDLLPPSFEAVSKKTGTGESSE